MKISELATEFEKTYMETRLRPATVRGYLINLNNHALPILGSVEVQALTVEHLDKLTAELRSHLSNRSIVYVHATMRKMLTYAVRRGYTIENPYKMFDMPKVEKYRYKTLTSAEISKALKGCKGTDIEIPVTLALCYGLRRGECMGIIVETDLDAGKNILHIQRTRNFEKGKTVITPCKTDNGDRLILLTEEHAKLIENAKNGGYIYAASGFTLNKHFRNFLKKNGLPPIRFHDLRHSYATFMLQQGVNPKIVSTVLGHSSVSVTLDIYSHPDVSMQSVCLQAIQGF